MQIYSPIVWDIKILWISENFTPIIYVKTVILTANRGIF